MLIDARLAFQPGGLCQGTWPGEHILNIKRRNFKDHGITSISGSFLNLKTQSFGKHLLTA
jgi:hypothetical protein